MPGSRRPHAYRAPSVAKDTAEPSSPASRLPPLASAVQTLAQYRGLSLMALARASAPGRDSQEIYRIARGQCREIKVGWLLRVCRALSCDPDALLRLAGLWPTAAIGDRGSAFGDDDAGNAGALLDFQLSEAEDTVACWPDGLRSGVLRVLESMAPLCVPEEPAHVCPERAHHTCHALARQYLDAEAGSEREAYLAAELSACLTQEQGRVSPAGGGDALAVLARLRRRDQDSV